jgi:spermidine synthase
MPGCERRRDGSWMMDTGYRRDIPDTARIGGRLLDAVARRIVMRRLLFRWSILLLLLLAGQDALYSEEIVLYEKNSVYHYIRVTEDTSSRTRYLGFDKMRGSQSKMYIDKPYSLAFEYTRMSIVSLCFSENVTDILVVGLGGGSIPNFIHRCFPEINIDVVEIDPYIVEVSREYFGFSETPRMKVHIDDGRLFIRRASKLYDVIILDAYNDHAIPFHMTTQEFLREVKSKLKPNGLVASNIWSPSSNRFHYSEILTYQSVFPQLYLFGGLRSGNHIFIATRDAQVIGKEDLLRQAEEMTKCPEFDFSLSSIIEEQYEYATEKAVEGKILTDDYSPAELLRLKE